MRESGRLDDPSPVKPEMQEEGKPKSYIGALQEEVGATGATRNPAETSTAEGMRSSG
jgi:hypothetical protein